MSSRRTAILIGAIAIGVVAVLLIVKYVQGIQETADFAQEKIPVFVAKEEVKRSEDGGAAADEKRIVQGLLPREFVPSNAITSLDAIRRKVALFTIQPGMVVVDGMFVDPQSTVVSFRDRLKDKNFVAVSIQVSSVSGVGGFLVPGDHVNMLIFQDNANVKAAIEASGQPGATPTGGVPNLNLTPLPPPEAYIGVGGPQWLTFPRTARYLFQNVAILAVGANQLLGPGEQSASGTTTAPAGGGSGLITLQVPPEAAQWIISAGGDAGGFYLTLVRADYKPRDNLTPLPVALLNLPGEDAAILTPYNYTDPDGNTPESP